MPGGSAETLQFDWAISRYIKGLLGCLFLLFVCLLSYVFSSCSVIVMLSVFFLCLFVCLASFLSFRARYK